MGDLLQVIFYKRRPCFHNIDNALRQTNDGAQFDGAIELDILHLHPLLRKEFLRNMRIFRCNARMCIIRETAAFFLARHSHHQPTFAKSEIQQFIDILPRFQQHILADDADICSAVFHIGRHIRGFCNDEPHFDRIVRDDEFSGFFTHMLRSNPDLLKQIRGQRKQFSLGQCNR